MPTYRLQSASFVSAPGLVAWAINGYFFEADRPQLLRVVCDTWGVPEDAAEALLKGEVEWTFANDPDEEIVEFTFPAGDTEPPGAGDDDGRDFTPPYEP